MAVIGYLPGYISALPPYALEKCKILCGQIVPNADFIPIIELRQYTNGCITRNQTWQASEPKSPIAVLIGKVTW